MIAQIKIQKKLFFLLLIMSVKGYGQNIMKGKIINSNKKPIEFATIKNNNSNIHSISNEKGEFEIACFEKDTLSFTHISFQEKTISVLNISKKRKVILENKSVPLDEVIIFNKNKSSIIDKIINSIDKNFKTKTSYTNYQLLNEVETIDSITIGYFNGLIQLQTPSYIKKKPRLKAKLIDTKIHLNNYKKIPYFYYQSPNSIMLKLFPLNLPFIKKRENYIFRQNQINESDIGKISFKPKKNTKFTYKGFLYYDLKNLAILYIEYELLDNENNKGRLVSLGLKKSSTETIYKKEQYKIKYLEKNNRYILESLHYKSFVTFKSKKEYQIKSRLNLVLSHTKKSYEKLPRLNLSSLKSSNSQKNMNLPYIDPFTKKHIEKMIKDKVENE